MSTSEGLRYRVDVTLNADGMQEAPGFEVVADSLDDLVAMLREELANDYDVPLGVGMVLRVERLGL